MIPGVPGACVLQCVWHALLQRHRYDQEGGRLISLFRSCVAADGLEACVFKKKVWKPMWGGEGEATSPYYNRKPDTTTRSPILQLGLDLGKTRNHHITTS